MSAVSLLCPLSGRTVTRCRVLVRSLGGRRGFRRATVFPSASQLFGPWRGWERSKKLCDAAWLGGGSFLCRRKLLPLHGVRSCVKLSMQPVAACRVVIACCGEGGVQGTLGFIPDVICLLILAPYPVKPSGSPSPQHQEFWLRSAPALG